MFKNDFIIRVNKSGLVLKTDQNTLQDIAHVLDHLTSIVHLLRKKAYLEEKRKERKQQSHQIEVNRNNRHQSKEIYERYLLHLNNGCNGNRTNAQRMVAEEYHLKIIDAEFYIRLGRKINKEENLKRQGNLF